MKHYLLERCCSFPDHCSNIFQNAGSSKLLTSCFKRILFEGFHFSTGLSDDVKKCKFWKNENVLHFFSTKMCRKAMTKRKKILNQSLSQAMYMIQKGLYATLNTPKTNVFSKKRAYTKNYFPKIKMFRKAAS